MSKAPKGYISISEFVEREEREGRGKLFPTYVLRLAVGGVLKVGKRKKIVRAVMKMGEHCMRDQEQRVWLNERLRILRRPVLRIYLVEDIENWKGKTIDI